jgi:hypothetical protein
VIAVRKQGGELRFNPGPTEPRAQGDPPARGREARALKDLEQKLA